MLHHTGWPAHHREELSKILDALQAEYSKTREAVAAAAHQQGPTSEIARKIFPQAELQLESIVKVIDTAKNAVEELKRCLGFTALGALHLNCVGEGDDDDDDVLEDEGVERFAQRFAEICRHCRKKLPHRHPAERDVCPVLKAKEEGLTGPASMHYEQKDKQGFGHMRALLLDCIKPSIDGKLNGYSPSSVLTHTVAKGWAGGVSRGRMSVLEPLIHIKINEPSLLGLVMEPLEGSAMWNAMLVNKEWSRVIRSAPGFDLRVIAEGLRRASIERERESDDDFYGDDSGDEYRYEYMFDNGGYGSQ
jgi:hypothetical protein